MKTWILLCGYCNKSKALAKYVAWGLVLCVTNSHAQPESHQALEEDFLLFLADSIEYETELLDPLSMIESNVKNTGTQVNNETNTDNKEANDE